MVNNDLGNIEPIEIQKEMRMLLQAKKAVKQKIQDLIEACF